MQSHAFKNIAAPLVLGPVVDDKLWNRLSANDSLSEDSSRVLDQIVLQYLSARSVDFQRCNEALTI